MGKSFDVSSLNFSSVPTAWPGVVAPLQEAFKIAIRDDGSPDPRFVVSDLTDFKAEDLDFSSLFRDLQLLQAALVLTPEKLRRVVEIYTSENHQMARKAGGGDWAEASQLLTEMNLTEESSVRAGGGILPLLLLAVVLGGSCATVDWAERKKPRPDGGTLDGGTN